MSTHKHIDRICWAVVAFALLLTVLFLNGEALGIQAASSAPGYETRLFDTSCVHTIDIVMDDWESFIQTCESEEYSPCTVIIDGEAYKNVGLRAKGNTSLSSVSQMDSDRYSFKLEFDQYDSTRSYYGLDKLSLNNLIQDNTMMKDFVVYETMRQFGAAAPLCSYVSITVNGEDWGLYLAVEGVEEAFLRRNYGSDYGELYKPDSMNMGGGRGNGARFDLEDFDFSQFDPEDAEFSLPEDFDPEDFDPENIDPGNFAPGKLDFGNFSPGNTSPDGSAGQSAPEAQRPQRPENSAQAPTDNMGGRGGMGNMGGGMGGGMGSEDVKLQYVDDDPDSYPNIFDSAKTDLTEADKTRLIQSLKRLSEGEALEEVLDVDAVLRYFVVHNFVVNGDSYTGSMIHNYYLYEEDGRLTMLPWDYNLAFGTFQGGSASSSVNEDIHFDDLSDRPMADWIFRSEEYTALYEEYYSEFLLTCLDSGWLTDLISTTAELIAPYVERDPSKFCTYEEFLIGAETLEQFCALRTESVAAQLSGSGEAIDTGDLSLSDMGTMGMGMGGGRDFGGGDFPGFDSSASPDSGSGAEDSFPGMQGGQRPDGTAPSGGMAPPR